jgi:hypothetical protein
MMKLTNDYTEIVGVTHRSGEEECHDLLPQVTQLEAKLKTAAEMAFNSEVVQTGMLEIELEDLPGVSRAEYKKDWIYEWMNALSD